MFEKGQTTTGIHLLDPSHSQKTTYNPIQYAKAILEKHSKNFKYLGGYKKPNVVNIDFPEPKLDIFKFTSLPLNNVKIQNKFRAGSKRAVSL